MNWMNKLMRKSEAKPAPLPVAANVAAPVQAPRLEDSPALWATAVCQSPDKAQALAWTQQIDDAAALAEVAMQARYSEVRLAALQRIGDPAVLERIAQHCRHKDKGVYRHCVDRLRLRHQAEDDSRRAAAAQSGLQDLLAAVPLPLSRLLELEKDLRALAAATPGLPECMAMVEQARTRLRQETALQRELQAMESAAGDLLAECSRGGTDAAQGQAWRERLDALLARQAGLPAWLSKQAALLADRLAAADSCLQRLAAEAAAATARAELLALQAASVPAEPAPPPPVAVPPVPPVPKIDRERVLAALEKMEAALAEGHMAAAEAEAKALDAILAGQNLQGSLNGRLQSATAQLAKLRGWARWGTRQAREELVAAAEALLSGSADIDALAQGVQVLREKWKELNAHAAADKSQWERFDRALSTAYKPVAAHRAEEAARQALALAAKEALCAEWEGHFAAVIWEHADYKVIEAQRQDMLRRWREAEDAGFRAERTLRKRLDKLVAGIDQRLQAARDAELARREQLIAAAEALVAAPDLGSAVVAAKALQERWTEQTIPLRLKRAEEQKLWQRFRSACAEVFARRDAQRAEKAALRTEQLAQRELQKQAQARAEAQRRDEHNLRFELLVQKAALAESVEAAAAAAMPVDAAGAAARQAWDALPRLPGAMETALAGRLTRAAAICAAELVRGRETRLAILLDLEIALDLPSPQDCAEARRRRQLERLQHRFGAERGQQTPPAEALLLTWYATAAAPDAALEQRMALVRKKLGSLSR